MESSAAGSSGLCSPGSSQHSESSELAPPEKIIQIKMFFAQTNVDSKPYSQALINHSGMNSVASYTLPELVRIFF